MISARDNNSAIERMIKFFEGNDSCFILKGGAGTGKTTSLVRVLEYLNNEQIPYELLAPTGRAAKNLRDRLKDTSEVVPKTIHSFLYEKTTTEGLEESYRVRFNLRKHQCPNNLVVIIDEASMISHITQEDEYLQFGSGNVLEDLLAFIKLNQTNRKLIFIGDELQLPPVHVKEGITLNPEAMQPYFYTPVDSFVLTEVYRQSKTSVLLQNVTSLRNSLENGKYTYFPVKASDPDIMDLELSDAIDEYLWSYGKEAMFIADSNKEVHQINMIFREKSEYSPDNVEKQERLIIMKNCWLDGNRLYNGEFVKVEDVGEKEEVAVRIKTKDGIKEISLSFLNVKISFRDEMLNVQAHIPCKILEHKLWTDTAELTAEENQALIVHFRNRHPQLKPKSNEYQVLLQRDPYVNALFVRFGYAVTCHKAQGGEWDKVFVSLNISRSLYCKDAFRWCYTAMTRAKQQLKLIGRPEHEPIDIDDPFSLIYRFLQEVFAKTGYEIVSKKTIQYGIEYTFRKEGTKTRFTIYRNGRDKISSVVPVDRNEHTEYIQSILAPLKGRSLYDATRINNPNEEEV